MKMNGLTVVHQGKNPLYELNARVVDLELFESLESLRTLEEVTAADTDLQIGSVSPGLVIGPQPF